MANKTGNQFYFNFRLSNRYVHTYTLYLLSVLVPLGLSDLQLAAQITYHRMHPSVIAKLSSRPNALQHLPNSRIQRIMFLSITRRQCIPQLRRAPAVIAILILDPAAAAAVSHNRNQTLDAGVKFRMEATSGGSPPRVIFSIVAIVTPSLVQLAH